MIGRKGKSLPVTGVCLIQFRLCKSRDRDKKQMPKVAHKEAEASLTSLQSLTDTSGEKKKKKKRESRKEKWKSHHIALA